MDTKKLAATPGLEASKLLREAIDLPFTNDKEAWDKWCADWRARAEVVIDALELGQRETTTRPAVPEEYAGPQLERLLKRAGTIISCSFQVYTIRRKSTGEWNILIVLDDEQNETFCHAFEFSIKEAWTLAGFLAAALKQVDELESRTASA